MDLLFLVLLSSLRVTVESELIGSQRPIIGLVGGDVILPCYLEPPVSVTYETVVWTRPDLNPPHVHYHQDGRLMFDRQNSDYFLRTRLFMDELTTGNVSMKISDVKLSDAGTYRCSLPSMQKEVSIQLVVRESEVIGSHEPVKSTVGDDVILPCRLEPPFDVTTLTVEWRHRGTKVHLYHRKKDHLVDQHENFRGRTSLFYDEMIRGNISLKLNNVTEQDAGNYTCFVHKLVKRDYVTLITDQRDRLDFTEADSGDARIGVGVIITAVAAIFLLVLLLILLWKFRKRGKLPVSQQSPDKSSVSGTSEKGQLLKRARVDEAGNITTEELTGEVADLTLKLHEKEKTIHQLQMDLNSQSLPVYFQLTTSSSLSKRSLDDPKPFSTETRNLSDDPNLKSLSSTYSNPSKSVNSPQTRTQKLPSFSINRSQSQPCLTTLANLAEES